MNSNNYPQQWFNGDVENSIYAPLSLHSLSPPPPQRACLHSPSKSEHFMPGFRNFLQGVKQLRDEQKYCDFVVECGSLTFPVHRVVLCSRSDYFKRACGGSFSEAKDGTIKLHDEDPENVKRMLDYLYQLKYQVGSSPPVAEQNDAAPVKKRKRTTPPPVSLASLRSSSSPSPVSKSVPQEEEGENRAVIHAQMYSMGDKYVINDLKLYALEQFKEAITSQTGAHLAESISEAYTSTPDTDRGLRDVVLDVTQFSSYTLTVEDREFQKLAGEIPLFGFELLQRTMKSLGRNLENFAECGGCRRYRQGVAPACGKHRAAYTYSKR